MAEINIINSLLPAQVMFCCQRSLDQVRPGFSGKQVPSKYSNFERHWILQLEFRGYWPVVQWAFACVPNSIPALTSKTSYILRALNSTDRLQALTWFITRRTEAKEKLLRAVVPPFQLHYLPTVPHRQWSCSLKCNLFTDGPYLGGHCHHHTISNGH